MKQYSSTEEIAEIICQAIEDEPYFTKATLIPKIRALIIGFRLRLASNNYSKVYTERGTARLVRAVELHNKEKYFWQEQLKNKVGQENMQLYYDLLDLQRKKWGIH